MRRQCVGQRVGSVSVVWQPTHWLTCLPMRRWDRILYLYPGQFQVHLLHAFVRKGHMVHQFSLQKQIIYFQEVLVPLGFSSILLTAPHQYTLYNHVCHKFMSGCLPAFPISWSLQQQCFLCDHSTNCLFLFPSFQVFVYR